MGTIITRKQGNNTYYLYQETYREKINKKDFGEYYSKIANDQLIKIMTLGLSYDEAVNWIIQGFLK